MITGAQRTPVISQDSGLLKLSKVAVTRGSAPGPISSFPGTLNFSGGARAKLSRVKLTHNGTSPIVVAASGGQAPRVVLSRSRVVKNAAVTGGAIWARGGKVVVKRSALRKNETVRGGAIDAVASGSVPTVKVKKSVISGNRALQSFRWGSPADVGTGGGIYSQGARVIVDRSTLSANSSGGDSVSVDDAGGAGGGIFVDGGEVTVTNSTVAQNTTTGDVATKPSAVPVVQLRSSTVALNVADTDTQGGGNGGGLASRAVSAKNTIVAANTDRSGPAPDCAGALTSLGHNLLQRPAGCTVSGTTAGNLISAPGFAAGLRRNGGPTPTIAIARRSAARNAGSGCPRKDQRGVRRKRCDIGSYERR